MPPAKPVLTRQPGPEVLTRVTSLTSSNTLTPTHTGDSDQGKLPLRPVAVQPKPESRKDGFHFQARVPVIAGEVTYRGLLPIDGVIAGQLGASGGALSVRQRPRKGPFVKEPELNGELFFKDMLRVNGYIAGKVISEKGTLIVAEEARLDADIEVRVAIISGVVNGDIVSHERVELGSSAYVNGNISTRSLSMKPGAVIQGDCRVLKDEIN